MLFFLLVFCIEQVVGDAVADGGSAASRADNLINFARRQTNISNTVHSSEAGKGFTYIQM